MKARGGTSVLAMVCVCMLYGVPVRAGEIAPSAAVDQRKALAQGKYEQGVEAFRNERYMDAVRLFLDADAIAPSVALSYNIARAYEKLGDDAAELRWYRNYLRLDPSASNRAQVGERIRVLSQSLANKGIQQLTVLSSPEGATVAIDGRAVGVTPLTIELAPGDHAAWLTARGYSDVRSTFRLTPTTAIDLPFTLTPRAPDEVQEPQQWPDVPQAAPHRRFGAWPFIALGAGAAALTGAVIFEVSRASAEDDARHQREQLAFEQDVNAMNSRQTAARVLLGVGGVLAVGGTVLLVFNTPLVPETRTAVATVPGGATVSLSRTF
jgi:hypothetical protein